MTFDLTDLGNAKRYAMLFNTVMKWVHESRKWYCWNGSKWGEDIDGLSVRNIDILLDMLKDEAKTRKCEDTGKWYGACQRL